MISFENVTKNYGALRAVGGINLTIGDGEFCALLGPNGAGKTTLIKILLDLTRATAGKTSIDGIASTVPQARASLGYLAENHRIPGHLTGKQYLTRHAELLNMEKNGARNRIQEVLTLVGMSDKAALQTRTYSKGMVQRIGLGAALLHSPRLLILDEPVSGLDPIGIREFRLILERLKSDKVTVLLSSHLLSEAEKICTSVAIMNKGTLIRHGRVEEFTGDGSSLEDIFVKAVQHESA